MRDQQEAVIVGATVTITDVQRGVTRTLSTGDAGEYVAPNLQPGVYKVRAEAKGFKSVERLNIQLEVAKDVAIDFVLEPGEATQTVTVSAEVPMLDTTTSTLGGTLSNEQINELPLNGRNYQNLLQLRPAVVRYPGGGFSTTSTNGTRAEDNAYLIEGLFNSEPYSGQGIINGAGIVGDSATILPIDAIQEFNLIENPPAEYGWKPGAIVNVALKSGTNGLHGTAYAFGRDDAFDARNFFNAAPNPKITTLEQYGGTVGGPLVKDKLFFFGGYEGQSYHLGNTFGVNTPATITWGGDPANSIPDAIAALQAADVSISTVSLKIAGCTLVGAAPAGVTCAGTGFPTNTTNSIGISQGFPNDANTKNALGKVDYHPNDRHTISGMYFFANNSGIAEDFPELQARWRSLIHTRSQVVGGSWIWTPSARWVNEARVGYSRLYQPTLPGDLNVNPMTAYGLNTGVPFGPLTGGLPRIGWGPAPFAFLGGFKWPKIQGPDSIIQFNDHLSYSLGIHAIKFGGEIHRHGANGGAFGNARSSFKFPGGNVPEISNSTPLEDFFAGLPTVASVLAGNPTFHLSNWAYALFMQDDIRLTRKLTVNLGLRYELNTVIKEQNNLLGNFDPNVGLVQVGKQISSPYNGNHLNFAPRAGFAWDPWGTGKTVIRGGGGLVYESVNWQAFLALNNSFGLNTIPTGFQGVTPVGGTIQAGNVTIFPTQSWDSGPVFTSITPASLSCAANPCAIMGVDPKLTTPYVANWTLNVQHAFTPNVSLEVAYVGNHGFNLTGIRDINQPAVGSGWAACIASNYNAGVCAAGPDGGLEQAARPFNTKFSFLSNIFQMGNIYKSNYNGLQTTLTARNYHGFTAVAGYTYSHALDDVGANWHFGYGNGMPMNAYNTNLEYATSDFDMRHRFTLSLTYVIPGKKSFAQMLEGWQLTSIVTLDSPQPWGVIDLGTDIAGTGPLSSWGPPANSPNRWDFFGNPNAFTSGPTPIPYFGPGSIPAACTNAANTPALQAALNIFGCYAKGGAVMIPPAIGTFGTMGRNSFKDSGFRNWDFSLQKKWNFTERFSAQFRAEFFNILNHPNFANPYGGQNGLGLNDPSVPPFGCGCVTPDVAAANPIIGSGGARAVQLGLKLLF